MTYEIILQPKAQEHLLQWKKSGQKKSILKIAKLIEELREHPFTGTGQVEQLRGELQGYWSRRIDAHNRLIYRVDNNKVIVSITSMLGHYGDK